MVASLAVVAGVVSLTPVAASATPSASSPLIINEVYGGGGNSGATYQSDFVELYNPGTAPVDVSSWSVQYASSTGTTWAVTGLTGSVPAGATYVVREASGTGGTTAVPADVTGTIAMAGGAGKVALVDSRTALVGSDQRTGASVIDLVGYGAANSYLGTGPTPAPSNTASVSRSATHANTLDNAADFTAGGASPCDTVCAGTVTPPPTVEDKTIAQIQGTTATSPLAGSTVRTTGVVTAVYPTGGLNGFFLQSAGTGGGDARTASDGIFVFGSTAPAEGSYVEVTGKVSEFNGLTELTPAAAGDVRDLGAAPAAVTAVSAAWPRTDAEREALEGMLFRPTGDYTITNTFATNTFGEVGLASGDTPLLQRTEVELPGPAASSAVEADNAARKVTLDDGASTSFSASNGITPSYVSNDAPVVVGGKATFTEDVVVDYRNGLWKLQPTTTVVGPANTTSPATFSNPRTAAPNAAYLGAADVKVASFNVLNYFTTLGVDTPGCTPFRDRTGNGDTVSGGCDLRGAWDAEDLARQQSKIVKAINGTTADVVGLMELENSAKVDGTPDEALTTLVAALNADAGSDVWAGNPSSTELPAPSERDVITNGIIYKKAVVSRVGDARALGTLSSGGAAFDNAREPIAQVFTPKAGGTPFLFVVNHFKSKGSGAAGDGDTGYGQGASNQARVAQATALKDWIPTVLTATGTKAVISVGDYNAYSKEDPIRVLNDAGYVDAEAAFPHGEYSYSFSGLSGSLDHVLLNAAALARATGADIWNINSGESLALEYSRYDYSVTDFHRADPYRSSDHDPVVVGLRAAAATVPVQILATNDFHGRLQASGAEAGAAVLAGAVKQLRAAQPNTVFAAAGDLIGASTFESFIAKDKPTIDALNEAGLEVSAVGNHELDQGYDDLVDRVMASYDADSNPYGGARWQYISANLTVKATGDTAVPATWIKSFGAGASAVQVGFVGAVTEHLPELVSPAGIADLSVDPIVPAVNREATDLRAHGADIVVLLVHEGSPTSECKDVTGDNDFGAIVNGVNDDVDAIVSGHTHLTYNCSVPVPGWADRAVTTRPVVSAGQYGTNLDQLLFQVDPETEKVVAVTSNTLPLANPAYPSDPATKAIVDKAVADANVLGAAKVGTITGPLNRGRTASGTEARGSESTLGNFVAEVQRSVSGAQIALMNPGGLRADLVGNPGGYPADVTYRQAANVQPFANTLVSMTLTGAQLRTVLEQQWQPAGSSRPFLRLGLSEGFTYTYDPAAAAGARILSMSLDGTPVTDGATYTVTANSFLAGGGDNFSALAGGTQRRDTGKVDLQSMVDYFEGRAPVSPDPTQRSVGVSFPAGAPATYAPGDTVSFALSSLSFTTPSDLKDSAVTVQLDGTPVGSFPVDNTLGSSAFDETGTAAVSFAVPAGTPAGQHVLTVLGTTTGTRATVPLETVAPAKTASTTTVTSSASPSQLGAAVRFTATVGGGAVFGSVQFVVDGQPVGGKVRLSGGTAVSAPISTLGAGTHTVTARYTGDAGVTPSSGTLKQSVQYVVRVLSPTPGESLARKAAVAVRFQLTDVNGTVVPDLEANGLLSTTCRVKAAISGSQTAAAACVTYDEASDEFRRTVASNGKAGPATVKLTLTYPGGVAQTVLVGYTRS